MAYSDFKDGQESVQLVHLDKYEFEGAGTKAHRIVLHTSKLNDDGSKGKSLPSNKLVSAVDDTEKKLINGAAKGVDEGKLTIVKVFKKTENGGFWNLASIKPASAYTPKEKKEWKGGQATSKGRTGGYDNVGQQIGNAINNAAITLGAGCTMEQMTARARDIIRLGNQLRKEYETGSLDAPKETAAEPTSSAEEDWPAVDTATSEPPVWDSVEDSFNDYI